MTGCLDGCKNEKYEFILCFISNPFIHQSTHPFIRSNSFGKWIGTVTYNINPVLEQSEFG
ncbi:MAG TPA: hypothetical protein DCZ94_14320 [Lentisphaeria bacterium]|nr:hypothetical protein [Lentisphaeria bacterium]